MVGFFIGLFTGGTIGAIIMSVIAGGSRGDTNK